MLNRRGCRAICMSDNAGLSDMAENPAKTPGVVRISWPESPEKRAPRVDFRARSVGEPEFVGLNAPARRSGRNFGTPIHNSWDAKIRNLWDSRMICGTAPRSAPVRPARTDFDGGLGVHQPSRPGLDAPARRPGPRPQNPAWVGLPLGVGRRPLSRVMSSKSIDSPAMSLQSGPTNYESKPTPVPGIVNQSRNCATGKSLDFNE